MTLEIIGVEGFLKFFFFIVFVAWLTDDKKPKGRHRRKGGRNDISRRAPYERDYEYPYHE